jgi:hypothetical protein
MTIEDKIKNIDCQLFAIKLEVNSYYSLTSNPPLTDNLVDKYWSLKKEKGILLKRKKRLDKLKKINESNLY